MYLNGNLHFLCSDRKNKNKKKFMAVMNFYVLHLLFFLEISQNHYFIYFLKFEKSVSVLTSFDKELQMRGPKVIKLLENVLLC